MTIYMPHIQQQVQQDLDTSGLYCFPAEELSCISVLQSG